MWRFWAEGQTGWQAQADGHHCSSCWHLQHPFWLWDSPAVPVSDDLSYNSSVCRLYKRFILSLLAIQGSCLGGFRNGIFSLQTCEKWPSEMSLTPLYQLRSLDYIHVMTYDLHGSWEGYTGENSPLYKNPTDTGSTAHLHVVSPRIDADADQRPCRKSHGDLGTKPTKIPQMSHLYNVLLSDWSNPLNYNCTKMFLKNTNESICHNIRQFYLLEQGSNITEHWAIGLVGPLANLLPLQDYAMNYWKDNGAPAGKLIIGFSAYGCAFILSNPSDHAIGAPTTGPGPAGPYARQPGFLAYYEVCSCKP